MTAELNRLSDEEVRVRVAEALGFTRIIPNFGCIAGNWVGEPPFCRGSVPLPDWLTDLNAALTLCDKMREELSTVSIWRHESEWHVVFHNWSTRENHSSKNASLARAICLAFLLAAETNTSLDSVVRPSSVAPPDVVE